MTPSSKPPTPNTEEARRDLVEIAREWVGTPYKHAHQMLGIGCDCVGLVLAVGRAAGVLNITPADWAPYRGYSRTPNPKKMALAMAQFLVPLTVEEGADPPDGTVVWLGWRQHLPMHLAIMASAEDGRRTIIHAFEHVGLVVENGYTSLWRDRSVSWWAYPGLAEE